MYLVEEEYLCSLRTTEVANRIHQSPPKLTRETITNGGVDAVVAEVERGGEIVVS